MRAWNAPSPPPRFKIQYFIAMSTELIGICLSAAPERQTQLRSLAHTAVEKMPKITHPQYNDKMQMVMNK